MNVSLFRTIVKNEDINNPAIVKLESVIKAIKNGKWKKQIELIRNQPNKKERDRLKRNLPGILFGGEFSSRRIDGFKRPSGVVTIDFDGLPESEIVDITEKLKSLPYVLSVFRSPSNKGVKALIRANFDTYEDYKSVFCAIDSELGKMESFDMQNSDISRACFVSYDPQLYYNPNAEIFTGYVDDWEKYLKDRRLSSPPRIMSVLRKWMSKNGYEYVKGSRNSYAFILASAMCRYGVLEDITKGLFIQAFNDLPESEISSVVKSAYARSEFGKVQITDVLPEQDTQFYRSLEVPDFSFDPQSVIPDKTEINEAVYKIASGELDFQSFGLKEMDKYFVLKSNELYGFVAKSKSGKTTLIAYLMLMAAKHAGWRFLVLTTETEIEDFKSTLVSFICNKHIKRCSKQQITQALEFIDRYFEFIENDVDHLQIFDVYHYLETKGIYFNCILIDPITNVKKTDKIKSRSPNDYYEDLYIEYLKFTKKYCSIWVITHTVVSKERENVVPHVPDAEYGSQLARRCHYGITFYRDPYDETTKNTVECHVKYVRTAFNRGGGVTLSDHPIKFHLITGKNQFGYDIEVDNKRFNNPLIYGHSPEIKAPSYNFYEPQKNEDIENEGFTLNDKKDTPF